MKFVVTILAFRKGSMLDPETVQILKCLKGLGYKDLLGLRKARAIILEVDANDQEALRKEIDRVCKEPEFINQVSETTKVEIAEVKPESNRT